MEYIYHSPISSGTFTIANDLTNCSYCGLWHSGTCPRIKAIEYHPNGTAKRVEFHGSPGDTIGLKAIKTCIRCGNPALFPTVLPYSSKYDDETICGNCVVELIDPAIDEARRE